VLPASCVVMLDICLVRPADIVSGMHGVGTIRPARLFSA
jgi:hypothetical protein